MALIKCPDCGKMFSDHAEKCPACGCTIEHVKEFERQKTEEERERRRKEEEERLRKIEEKRAARKAYIEKNKGKIFTCAVVALVCITAIAYWTIDNHLRAVERAKQEEMALLDSIHRADSIRNEEIRKEKELEEAKKKAAIEFIKDFYNTYKYEDYSFLKKHCSASMLKKLRDDYDYDCKDDDCFAVWDFRSGCQDGYSDKHGIINITPLGEDWYQYEFYDMGWKGSHVIKIIVENDKFIIDDLIDDIEDYRDTSSVHTKNSLPHSTSTNEHDYVDLGLPSGTLWATTNIGADSPKDYGDYFAWGETTGYNSGKTTFDWSTYKWCNGSSTTLTKYNDKSSSGTVDNKTVLDVSDDAAYTNWGSDWRMPTNDQFDELVNSSYTTTIWTTQNGIYGYKITSKLNGKSIFLPAAGIRVCSLDFAGTSGHYWSRTLYASRPYRARPLYFNSRRIYASCNYRYSGLSVRPVRNQ